MPTLRDLCRLSAALLSGALVSGCIHDRDWPTQRPVSASELAADQTLATAQVDEDAWPEDNWWKACGDSQLDTLMTEALAGSPTLQTAEARLRQAQALATSASAPRVPNTTVDAETSRQRYSANGTYPPPFAGNWYTEGRGALDFSYDVDFWGHNRELLESARASVRAARADQAAARLALTVAVARAYFDFSLQFALLDIANASLLQQNSILELTRQRAAHGLENVARVKQSEGTVALTRAGVQYEEAAIKIVRSQLGALLGAGPDRGVDLHRPALQAPRRIELPSRLPAQLLGRRPDILAQRWRVESATRGISAAEAAFYPNVNLTAFAGFQAIGLGSLFNGGSGIAGAGPAVSLPIFNRRQLRGALQSQQAQYDYAVAQYNQTLIDALNDVANVVTNWEGLVRQADEARVAEDAAQAAYSISRDRYRAGLDNYLTVLSSENQVFSTQAIRAQLLARELNLTADLARALGGGYSADTPPGN